MTIVKVHGGLRERVIGTFLGRVIRWYSVLLRWSFCDHVLAAKERKQGGVIYTFWHNRILILGPFGQRYFPDLTVACLTSASKDGALIESVMRVFRVDAIRGSSSRRGRAAMGEMLERLGRGESICITPDGPRGPRYQVNPGVMRLAERAEVSIVPVRVDYERYWEVKSWDRFRIPKPFSRVQVSYGAPVRSVESEREKILIMLEESLNS